MCTCTTRNNGKSLTVEKTYMYCYSLFLLSSPVSNVRPYCFLLGFFSAIIKVFRFQRKTLLFLLGFFFPIIIILCLTDFVQRISRKRLDGFSWNFHTWYLMIKIYYTFFYFDDVTSGFEISTILWFFIGPFVLLRAPKRGKRDIWNFHGW